MILFDDRWLGPHGIGRFAKEVMKRLPTVQPIGGTLLPTHPLDPLWISWRIYKVRPDAFYSSGINAPMYSTSPFVFTIHDLNHLCIPSNSSALKRMYYQFMVRPACKRAFKIITVSEFSRRSIIEWSAVPETHVVNVGNGVEATYSPDGENYCPGYPFLLYVGNRKPHKNIPRLLEAFAISHVQPNVKLIMSGSPDDTTTELIVQNRLENDVIFAGLIPEAKLPSYYRGALALVFPSLYEGFGLPVLEAMACGTPVITSRCTAIPEVAGKACLLVDPKQTDEIAEAIRRVINDSVLTKNMRLLGIEQAKRFTWEKTAAEVRSVLEEAAGI